MAHSINKLNVLKISKLTQSGYYGDGRGLYLQVSRTGSKSWIFRFSRAGHSHEMGLGSLRDVTLAQARALANEHRQALLAGQHPLQIQRQKTVSEKREASGMTFDQCAEKYIEAHRPSWKSLKHADQWGNTLKDYVSPAFGSRCVSAVDTPAIVKVLKPIWMDKTETATRVRGRIERVLDWAAVCGYRAGDNPARWRGHLENLLPAPKKVTKVQHHPALPWTDVQGFWKQLQAMEGIAARALELVVLTACRSGEVRGAQWHEFDMESLIWTIPGERMKGGIEHRVPLSMQAMRLIEQLPRLNEHYVFPGTDLRRPLSDMSLTAVLRRMECTQITVHGFRSTFRDWAAETTTYPREVCEEALAHKLKDKVEAAYRRSDLLERRRSLMQDWGRFVEKDSGE